MEGESINDWDDRIYAIWLAEEEEYALHGQFYQFKHIIRDDRPSTAVVRKAEDPKLDQQYCKPILLTSETQATLIALPN